MRLSQIWRFPVKSMGGEPLSSTDIGPLGIPGDRVVHVASALGRVVTSRSRPGLLLHHAALGADGEPRVDGRPWADPAVRAEVEAIAGPGARLVRFDGAARFDILPLLVATDGAIAAIGEDSRRFRPNLMLADVPGLAERGWEGRRLRIGTAVVRAVTLRRRCIMTTFDPDTAAQNVEVLLKIQRDFAGTLALDTEVVEPGQVTIGDEAVLLD